MFYSYFILGFGSFWPLDYRDNLVMQPSIWYAVSPPVLLRYSFILSYHCAWNSLIEQLTVASVTSLLAMFTLHIILLGFYFLCCAEPQQKCILQNMLALSSLNPLFLVPETHKQRSQLLRLLPVEQSLWLQLTALNTDRWHQNSSWIISYCFNIWRGRSAEKTNMELIQP